MSKGNVTLPDLTLEQAAEGYTLVEKNGFAQL